MKTRPILFSAPMVRAILDGSKTQTRRVVKPQPITRTEFKGEYFVPPSKRTQGRVISVAVPWVGEASPHGQIGDQLWVRETFMDLRGGGIAHDDAKPYRYRADFEIAKELGLKWKPSIFMPRAASRITLEITGVRVERLNDIDDDQAGKEGAMHFDKYVGGYCDSAKIYFKQLWESINGKGSWDMNPYVWVIEFKRVAA